MWTDTVTLGNKKWRRLSGKCGFECTGPVVWRTSFIRLMCEMCCCHLHQVQKGKILHQHLPQRKIFFYRSPLWKMDKTQCFMNSVIPLFCGKHSITNVTTSTFWNVTSGVKITRYFIKRTSYEQSNTRGVRIWGCFADLAPGWLTIIDGNTNSSLYHKMLKENIQPSVDALKPKHNWVMDNDPASPPLND